MIVNTIKKLLTVLILSSSISFSAELIDAGFEEPDIGATYEIVNVDTVPGWKTSASDNMMEIWHDGFNGTPAFEGVQFAEINANEQASLYQDIVTVPGSTLTWYMAHRGRDGVDVAEVSIGAASGTMTVVETMSDGNTAWGTYSGTYTVPAGQTVTRFSFDSVSQVGGDSFGNFIDDFRIEGGGVIAYPNTYTIYTDGSLSGNVITDGTPDYGQPLTIDSFTDTSDGVLSEISIGGDGNFTYTPDPGFEGTDTFTYTVADGYGGYDTQTVTINVIPQTANDDIISTDYNTPVSGNVLTNDEVDPSVTVIGNTSPNPTEGTITDGVNPDGTFEFTPASGFSGTVTFTYTLSNGLIATVMINVADAPIVVDTNLVADYRLDECGFDGTTSDVIDNSINGLNGTSFNGTSKTTTSDKVCTGAQFDGTSNYVSVSNDAKLNITGDMTVSFWVYPTRDNTDEYYVSKRNNNNGWYVWFDNRNGGDRIEFQLRLGNSWRNVRIDKPSGWLNNWHMITAVYDSTSGMRLYIKDSVGNNLSDSNNRTGTISTSVNTSLLFAQYNNGSYFQGSMDEVKIFNNAFTAAEVTSMYDNESAGRNWNNTTDARVCNTCQCTAKAGSNLISLPADLRNMPTGNDIASVITGDISSSTYGDSGDWQMAVRNYDIVTDNKNDASYEIFTDTSAILEYGKAYWLANRTGSDITYEANLKTMDFNATVDNYPSCRSANGKCALIELEEPNGTSNNGPYIYTMTSFAVQKPIRWENVRVLIDGVSYTPDQAQALGETFSATIWRYDQDGNNYTSVTPGTPGLNNEITPCSGYWVELDKNTAGKRVQLLIPEE